MFVYIDKKKIELKENSTGKDLVEKLNLRQPQQSIAMAINGSLVDIANKLSSEDKIKIIDFNSVEGKDVFWHTSAHVLAHAIIRLCNAKNL